MTIREETPEDIPAIAVLNDRAFGETAQSGIIAELRRKGEASLSLVMETDGILIGHILLYRVLRDGRDDVIGLGPVCVHPDHQKTGIGGNLIRAAIDRIDPARHAIVFLLGHESYYPRFGFSSEVGARFVSPWPRPAFMGLELRPDAPTSGTLTFPRAYL